MGKYLIKKQMEEYKKHEPHFELTRFGHYASK